MLRKKKSLEKIIKAFEKLPKFNILVNWLPPENTDICPSSIAKFFSFFNYSVETCKPELKIKTRFNMKVPNFKINDDSAIILAEWIGICSLDSELFIDDAENYICTYDTPEPYIFMKKVHRIVWSGFFTLKQINRVMEACR